MRTMSLGCAVVVEPSGPSTPDVLLLGHWLQMIWIDAMPNTTEMVKLHPIRNLAVHQLVGKAMGQIAAVEASIAIATNGSGP